MVRHKHKWREDWHHRVPDFKLVYCGPEKKDTKHIPRKKTVEVSDSTELNETIANLEKKKKLKKIKQIN